MNEVTIVGAGPSGLLLAIELIRQGIKPIVLDSRKDPDVHGYNKWSKALAIHSRSLEVLSAVGVVEPFIENAIKVTAASALVN